MPARRHTPIRLCGINYSSMRLKVLFLGLLFLPAFSFSQFYKSRFVSRCDSIIPNQDTEEELVFIIVEEMPKPKFVTEDLEILLNKSMNVDDYNVENGDKFYIVLGINCRGDVHSFQFHKCSDTNFSTKIVENIDGKLSWEPAIQRSKPVEIQLMFPFIVVNNEIKAVVQIEDLYKKPKKKRRRKKY
jgi:hypothetical protein